MQNNVITLNFKDDYFVPMPVEKIQTESDRLVPFGEDNLFPQNLLDLTEGTSLVSSIIDKITKYVYGEGVNDEYNNIIVDDKGTTLAELIYGVIGDYITFGAFALQVRRNKFKEIKKIDRLRVERIRTNEDNDKFWYCKRWTKYAKTDLVYDAFKGMEAKEQADSIYYFKNPSGRHVYGFAPYWSSMDDIVTCKALSEYGTNTINNCFAPSAIITLCEGKPSSEAELKQVERDLNNKFAGTKNNAKLMVMFADSQTTAPKVESFQAADINAHYLSLKETTRENILAAFSVDGVLIGLHTNDGVFSQEAFEQSFKIFNKTEIQPIQQQIIKAFKKLGYEIEFKPFKIDWENESDTPATVTEEGEENQNNVENNELA